MEGEEQNSGWNNFSASADGYQATASNIEGPDPIDQGQILRRKERFRSILVTTVGILALFFGLLVFYFNLTNPFLPIILQAQKEEALAQEQQRKLLLVMQTQDTDRDGLTDWDELNTYKTSPYLGDSDSDGISDSDEVKRGTDPNCPEGQNCFSAGDNGTSTIYVAPSLNGNLVTQDSPLITINFIRGIMKETGMAAADVDALSDQEIMAEFVTYLNDNPNVAQQLADEGYDFSGLSGLTVSTAKTAASATVAPTAGTTTVTVQPKASTIDLKALNINNIDDLKNLSGAQIRQLMVQSGGSADLLASVNDDQLKALFIKQLEAKLNTNNN